MRHADIVWRQATNGAPRGSVSRRGDATVLRWGKRSESMSSKGAAMYIKGGLLAVIVLIAVLVVLT